MTGRRRPLSPGARLHLPWDNKILCGHPLLFMRVSILNLMPTPVESLVLHDTPQYCSAPAPP